MAAQDSAQNTPARPPVPTPDEGKTRLRGDTASNTPPTNSPSPRPGQGKTHLITATPDNESIRNLEKDILRRTNLDSSVQRALHEGRAVGQDGYGAIWDRVFNREYTRSWDNFLRNNSTLALEHASYEPIAQAIVRREERFAREQRQRLTVQAQSGQAAQPASPKTATPPPQARPASLTPQAWQQGLTPANNPSLPKQNPAAPSSQMTQERVVQKKTPSSPPTLPRSSKKTTAAAVALGGTMAIGSIIQGGIKVARSIPPSARGTGIHSSFLFPAYHRWEELTHLYPDISGIKTLEDLKKWITNHPRTIHPITHRMLSVETAPDEWIDYESHQRYLEEEKRGLARIQGGEKSPQKPTTTPPLYSPYLFYLPDLSDDSGEVEENSEGGTLSVEEESQDTGEEEDGSGQEDNSSSSSQSNSRRSNRETIKNRYNNMRSLAKQGKQVAKAGRLASSAASGISSAASAIGTAGSAAGSAIGGIAGLVGGGWIVAVIILLLLIIIVVILLFIGGGSGLAAEFSVTLKKSGPTQVENGQKINYTLDVSYIGNPSQIIVTDQLPENMDYDSATGPGASYDETTRTVTWNIPVAGGGGNGTSTGTPTTGSPPNPNLTTFEAMMRGQARNTGVLGDENSFIETIFKNVNPNRPLGNRDTYEKPVRTLYQTAIKYNINPLVLLTMWGVETTFSLDGASFGCSIHNNPPQGFPAQVDCSANNLNDLIVEFERKAPSGLPVANPDKSSCTYDDAFLYAYEGYTPVCSFNDDNSGARADFMAYIRDFLLEGAQ